MKKVSKLLIIIFLHSNGFVLFSQNKIEVNIFDENKEFISYANVVLYDHNGKIITSAFSINGVVSLENIARGNYKLCISYLGYKDTCMSISQDALKDLKLTANLAPDAKILEAINITTTKPTITINENNNISLNIENTVLKYVEDIEHLLKFLPGVIVTSEGIKVFGDADPQFMINGKEVFSQLEVKALKPEDIKTIELVTANAKIDASKKYAINIITIKKRKFFGAQIYDRLTYNRAFANEIQLYLSFNTNKIQQSLMFNNYLGKYKQTEISNNEVFINGSNFFKTSIEIQTTGMDNGNNLYYGINYDIDSNQYVGLQLLGYFNQLKYPSISKSVISDSTYFFNKAVETGSNYSFQASANYSYKMPKAGQLFFVVDFYLQKSKEKMDINENEINYIINSNKKYNIYAIKGEYNFSITKIKTNASLGFKLFRTENNIISIPNVLFADDIFNKKNNLIEQSAATYFQFNTLINKITISGGVRFEYYYKKVDDLIYVDSAHLIKKSDFFPNLSFRYNISTDHIMILNYSRNINRQAYDYITGESYYLNPYLYRIGNINLKPEIVNSLTLSYAFKGLLHFLIGYSNSRNYSNLAFSSKDTIIIAKYENFKKQDINFGITLSMERSRHRVNLTLNLSKSFISFPNYINTLKFPKMNFDLSLNYILNITKNFLSDISFRYHPKMQYDYIILEPEFNLSIGLKYFFLNKALRLGIYYDYNSINKYTQQYNNIQIYHFFANKQHVLYFTVLYKFNFNQKWVLQESSIEEERQRIK